MRDFTRRENKVGHNTLLNFLGQSIPLLVGVITIPFIIRGLGKDRFGVLALAWGIIVYFNLFDLGLSRAMTKFTPEFWGRGTDEEIPSLVWTSLFFNALLGLTRGAFLALVTPLLVERVFNVPTNLLAEARQAFIILAASLPLMTSSRILGGGLEGVQRFDLVNAVKASLNSLVFLLPCLALIFRLKLPGIIFLIFLANVGALAVYFFLCFRIFPSLKKVASLDRKLLRLLLTFGFWVTASNIIGPLLVYLDRFRIGSLLTMDNQLVERRIRQILGRKYRFDPEDDYALGIWNTAEQAEVAGKAFRGIEIFLGIIGSLTLLIGAVGVTNLMYALVKERTREIGIKMALGAKRRHIVLQFLLETVYIFSKGTFWGTAIAYSIVRLTRLIPISYELSGIQTYLLRPIFSLDILVIFLVILGTLVFFSGIFPAVRASRLNPVEALRYE